MRRRIVAQIAGGLALAALGGCASGPPGATGISSIEQESERLGHALAGAVAQAGFDSLVDFTHVTDGLAQPAAHRPNVDVAVIELDAAGAVVGVANVLHDRDHPHGHRVRVQPASLTSVDVAFSRWRLERWEEPARWRSNPAAADVVHAPPGADTPYMMAYPASLLKDMVAFTVLRMLDDGSLDRATSLTYHEVEGQTCGAPPSNPQRVQPPPRADGASGSVASWLDQMITVSDNFATCVLLQAIHDRGRLDEANAYFARIGLPTLRMWPSQPAVGSGWWSGTMTMGALDAAKLALVASGARGTLWTTPQGRRITPAELSESSRAYWRELHSQQSSNEALNPVNLCGSPQVEPGIPSTVSQRWIDGASGHVVAWDGDDIVDFGHDVRPCLATAEVEFLHKTGLTDNAGSDAGSVRALPGHDGRWYVVAVISNVGTRFGDAEHARSSPDACAAEPFICYPRAFGRLGAAIDAAVKARPAAVR